MCKSCNARDKAITFLYGLAFSWNTSSCLVDAFTVFCNDILTWDSFHDLQMSVRSNMQMAPVDDEEKWCALWYLCLIWDGALYYRMFIFLALFGLHFNVILEEKECRKSDFLEIAWLKDQEKFWIYL